MKLADAEWKVMNVVWDRHPITAREVLDRLGDETDRANTAATGIVRTNKSNAPRTPLFQSGQGAF